MYEAKAVRSIPAKRNGMDEMQSAPHVCSAVKILQHQADLQGLTAEDASIGMQAFQINIHIGEER
jgi:hypothetical protein